MEEKPFTEFQIPVYIRLYEEKIKNENPGFKPQVERAFFYSINQKKPQKVVDEKPRGNSKAMTRENYGQVLEAAEKQIELFGQKINEFDLVPLEIKKKDCLGCVYKTACRSSYFLNAFNR